MLVVGKILEFVVVMMEFAAVFVPVVAAGCVVAAFGSVVAGFSCLACSFFDFLVFLSCLDVVVPAVVVVDYHSYFVVWVFESLVLACYCGHLWVV